MATTVGQPAADGDSHPAARDPELTARFVDDALPYLSPLYDDARRLTRNVVDADDLLQETVLRAYGGFNTFCDGSNLRAWLFHIMTNAYINGLRRAQHRPGEYLSDHVTDQRLINHDRHSSRGQGHGSTEPDTLIALRDSDLAELDAVVVPVENAGTLTIGLIDDYDQVRTRRIPGNNLAEVALSVGFSTFEIDQEPEIDQGPRWVT